MDIKTKFNVGDTVYMVAKTGSAPSIKTGTISSVSTYHSATVWYVTYTFAEAELSSTSEDAIFPSKQALLAHLANSIPEEPCSTK